MKALLVIDMQKGDQKTYKSLYKRDQMVRNISKLIDAFKKSGNKVIEAKIWITTKTKTTMLSKCNNCGIANTPEAELFDELQNKTYDKRIKKTNYSAFWNTNLEEYLKENNITELYLTGIHMGCCVFLTGVDAFYRGYKTFLVTDASSSVDVRKGIDLRIKKFNQLVGELITTEELLNQLS